MKEELLQLVNRFTAAYSGRLCVDCGLVLESSRLVLDVRPCEVAQDGEVAREPTLRPPLHT